jgi:hypothetical protein
VFSVFLATHASGQIGNPTTESGMKPYGSYESGEIDSIALLNGKLNLDIPLVSWPQRGNLKFGFTIRYDDPRYQETFDSPGCGSPTYPCSYSSEFDGQGVVVTPDFGYGIYQQDVSLDNTDYGPVYAVVSPDGSSHQIGGGRSVDATGFKFDHTNSIITDPEGTRYYIAPSSYKGVLRNKLYKVDLTSLFCRQCETIQPWRR